MELTLPAQPEGVMLVRQALKGLADAEWWRATLGDITVAAGEELPLMSALRSVRRARTVAGTPTERHVTLALGPTTGSR